MKVSLYLILQVNTKHAGWQVYLPTIVGYVPEEMVKCMSAFLDACYIAHCQDIDTHALNNFESALGRFIELREVFRTLGVRPTGFSLPRQHSLVHYRRLVEDFGAPGGLCSSITESHHITAVKRPRRRSNRYEALAQMLLTNQHLDKLAAMRSDFAERKMLPAGHAPSRNTSHVHTQVPNRPRPIGEESNGEDEGPVEGDIVEGHVVLAWTRGTSHGHVELLLSHSKQLASIPAILTVLVNTYTNTTYISLHAFYLPINSTPT